VNCHLDQVALQSWFTNCVADAILTARKNCTSWPHKNNLQKTIARDGQTTRVAAGAGFGMPQVRAVRVSAGGPFVSDAFRSAISTFIIHLGRRDSMSAPPASQEMTRKTISFDKDQKAQYVVPPPGTPAADTLQVLGLEQPKALIIIIGGAGRLDTAMQSDALLKSRLTQLFSRGIARAAIETGALIIDGGTQSGVMALMGGAVADRGRRSILLGVAPVSKVTFPGGPPNGSIPDGGPLDPNHTHFVLAPADKWGGETEMMFELAAAMANPPSAAPAARDSQEPVHVPVVTVLVGGNLDGVAKRDLVYSVRRGWPIVVVEGSGELPDKIAELRRKTPDLIPDPDLAEIVEEGSLQLFGANGSAAALEQIIIRQMGENELLKMAWERFATYDANAKRHQRSFHQLQLAILVLGVFTTLLVLIQTVLYKPSPENVLWIAWLLRGTIIALPILTSILLAAASRFNSGSKWILLRGSAEAIKREIFRYRTQPSSYSDRPATFPAPDQLASEAAAGQPVAPTSNEARLAQRLEFISRQLMQTNVNVSALRPYTGPIPPKMYGAAATDDGLSYLTPARYIAIRLKDELSFYEKKTGEKELELQLLQWLILLAGGVGTFLAAVGAELWVALTTALATAFTTFLAYRQVEMTLTQYNQAKTNLEGVRDWWMALAAEEQSDQKNIDLLVDHTEKVLESELTGWVQQMQDALAELRKEPPKEGDKTGKGKVVTGEAAT
jgi:hypothetical protein